jgi:hypothetical protein
MNPFVVYSDPTTRMADRSDKRFCFVIEDLSHEEYKEQYKDTELDLFRCHVVFGGRFGTRLG